MLGRRAHNSMPSDWTPDVLGLDHRIPKLHIFQAQKQSGLSKDKKSAIALRSVFYRTQGCCLLLGCGHIKSEEDPLHCHHHASSANLI